jgi:hypothetical protein
MGRGEKSLRLVSARNTDSLSSPYQALRSQLILLPVTRMVSTQTGNQVKKKHIRGKVWGAIFVFYLIRYF